jgi:hypothetical protein
MTARHRYQYEVDRLLEAIGARVSELNGLRARGVGGRALADQEGELAKMRRRLETLVSRQTPNEPVLR